MSIKKTVNTIEVYEQNTLPVTCEVSGLGSLSGYTPRLMVKENLDDADSEALIDVTGGVTDLIIDFTIPFSDNEITPGVYYYDITLEEDAGSEKYTVVQDYYIILKSVRY
jgi:hypothetical protein